MEKLDTQIKEFIVGLHGSSRSAKVKKNILGSFGVKGISIIISLILVPLTIGYISSELYGIWLTLVTVISWAHLFDFGFGNGVRNKLAESIAHNDWQKARKYVSTAYFYFILVFIPICIIVFFICPYISWTQLLNVDTTYQELIVQVMRIVIISFSISMIVNIQNTVLRALQLNALASFFGTLGQILVLLVTFILTLTTEPSLIYLALVVSGCPIIINLICSFWLYGHKYKQLAPSYHSIDTKLVHDVLNLGLKFFVIQIAFLILYQTMNVIISHVSGPESVTEYNVVYQYISFPMLATSMVVEPFWSAFTDAYTVKDFGWMQRAYKKLLKMYLYAVLAVLLLAALYPIAFRLWLGDKVSVHFNMVAVVACYVLVMIWNSIHSPLKNGTGCIKISLYCSIVMSVINIPLALFLGNIFGAQGVVMSVGFLNLLTAGISYIQVNKLVTNTAKGIWSK